MKKTLQLALLIFIITGIQPAEAQIPNYVSTNGLVGWYPFNGNANDESGNGFNGTVNGAILTTDRLGNSNTAYSFDGVDDYINLGNPLGDSSIDFTISIWARREPNGGGITIAKMPGGSWSNGKWMIDLYSNNVNYCLPNQNLQGCTTFNNNINNDLFWHHIILVHNATTDILYLDDSIISNSPSSLVTQIAADIRVGGRENTLNFPYLGQLDDIGIWNRALTPQEISALYNASTSSLSESNPTKSIVIFPNPVHDILNIKTDPQYHGESYSIIDATGKLITIGSISSESMTINMENYVEGLYLFIVGAGQESFKFLKN